MKPPVETLPASFHKILRLTGRAIGDYDLIRAGDKIVLGLSGGKDSWTLLVALHTLRRKAPVDFDILAIKIDHPHTPAQNERIARHCETLGFPFELVSTDIEAIIRDHGRQGDSRCSFCARLRRGHLYTAAERHGAGVIALGHHREDLNETLLMNMLHSGTLKSMPPAYRTDDGRFRVIRPMCYVPESMIRNYAEEAGFPIEHEDCPWAAGNERALAKEFLADLTRRIPAAAENILAAQTRVVPSHLADKDLWDFR